MKSLTKSNIIILSTTILCFLVLQILSFDRSFYLPLLLGIFKIGLIGFGIFYTISKVEPNKNRILIILAQVLIVYGSYQLSLWKISAAIYINVVEHEYMEILEVLDEEPTFTEIFYKSDGDSLLIRDNGRDEPDFTNEEKEILKRFMIEHSYIELWRTEYGVAFIYHRFIDNMGGLLYCPNPEVQREMEADQHKYRSYDKVIENWYYHYRSG